MTEKRKAGLVSRLFELRSVIGILFAIYGLVCTVCGIAFTSQRELDKAAGVNVNLWTGIAMLVVAAAFFAWAVLNPPVESVKEPQEDPARQD